MSDFLVIKAPLSGDWCVVRDGARLTAYKPPYWSLSDRRGLSYSPGFGIELSRNPARALRQARRMARTAERRRAKLNQKMQHAKDAMEKERNRA